MTNPVFAMYKACADKLWTENGVKYSSKDPKVAAWMLDTLKEAEEAGDQNLRDKCAAGLMCRYWSVFTKEKIGVETDYDTKISYGWEAIEYALKYKAWQNPEKNVNADQAVKRCIKTIFLQHNYNANLDKNKANNFAVSLDEEVGEPFGSEGKTTLGDTLVDEEELATRAYTEDSDAVRTLVQSYINKKKLVEAIIFDTIAFNDVDKETRKVVKYTDSEGETKKYVQVYKEFWPFKCVQILSQLPTTYSEYFGEHYRFNPAEFDKALAAIRGANNQKLYKYLSRALADARTMVSR